VNPRVPTTFSWTGAAGTSWSNPNNWNPIGIPASGDSLGFPSATTNKTSTNDLPAGTAFAAIAVNDFGYAFSGNRIVLTGTLANNGMNQLVLDLPVDIQGNSVNVSGMMGFRFNAPLIGPGRSTTPMRDSSSRDPILSPEPSSWATAR
jgi:protein involved in sex pheromone biosynthesis